MKNVEVKREKRKTDNCKKKGQKNIFLKSIIIVLNQLIEFN